MPIELTIRVTSPLSPDDQELLSGVAVMTLAVANHEMARNAFPDAFPPDATPESEASAREIPGQPSPCAFISPDDASLICVGDIGHRGRHKFRRLGPQDPAALAN